MHVVMWTAAHATPFANKLPFTSTAAYLSANHLTTPQRMSASHLHTLHPSTLHPIAVCSGRIDAYYQFMLKPYDVAAGIVILEEAGGRVTTADGAAYSVFDRSLLATNDALYEQVRGLNGCCDCCCCCFFLPGNVAVTQVWWRALIESLYAC